jgi:hypothetical protein
LALENPGFEKELDGWRVTGPLAGIIRRRDNLAVPEGSRALGYLHLHDSEGGEEVPRKLEPPERSVALQEVTVEPGRDYLLSALIYCHERGGGWQRNNRARLLAFSPARADAAGRPGELATMIQADPKRREACATAWYSTGGEWRRLRHTFRSRSRRAVIGLELYRWWALEKDCVLVDGVRLEEWVKEPRLRRK